MIGSFNEKGCKMSYNEALSRWAIAKLKEAKPGVEFDPSTVRVSIDFDKASFEGCETCGYGGDSDRQYISIRAEAPPLLAKGGNKKKGARPETGHVEIDVREGYDLGDLLNEILAAE
jgi:hypothetical protein